MRLQIKKPIIIVPLKFGLIGGLLYIILFFVLHFLVLDPLSNALVPAMVLMALFIFFSIKEFKVYYNQRKLHYWQGMTIGFINYFLFALVSFIFILLFTSIIEPEAVSDNIHHRMEMLESNKENYIEKIGSEGYQDMRDELQKTTGLGLAFGDLLLKIIIGLFLTIIFSLILRKH